MSLIQHENDTIFVEEVICHGLHQAGKTALVLYPGSYHIFESYRSLNYFMLSSRLWFSYKPQDAHGHGSWFD